MLGLNLTDRIAVKGIKHVCLIGHRQTFYAIKQGSTSRAPNNEFRPMTMKLEPLEPLHRGVTPRPNKIQYIQYNLSTFINLLHLHGDDYLFRQHAEWIQETHLDHNTSYGMGNGYFFYFFYLH